jgi:hypothetical protein
LPVQRGDDSRLQVEAFPDQLEDLAAGKQRELVVVARRVEIRNDVVADQDAIRVGCIMGELPRASPRDRQIGGAFVRSNDPDSYKSCRL